MLTELKVSQFAIIDHVHIQFNPGLNILSGETGAGKSILIKSLALLMGAKSSSQDIRSQKDQALIEGAFDLGQRDDIQERLKELGLASEEQELIVRRVIQKNGKGKIYLNGHLSTLMDLREIVFPLVTLSNPTEAPLIEITGQHENKDLMSSRYQMDTLDLYCGNGPQREKIFALYEEIRELEQEIVDLEALSQQREQQLDFLQFQIKEIKSLGLTPDEDILLKERIRHHKDFDKRMSWIQSTQEALSESEYAVLPVLKNLMLRLPSDSAFSPLQLQIKEAYNILEDVSFELQKKSNQEAMDPAELEALEERLSRIRKLQKKFGDDINQIISSLEEMETKYQQLSHLSDHLEQARRAISKKTKELIAESQNLSQKRQQGAKLLSQEVNTELKELDMRGLEFIISIEKLEEPQSTGIDRVIFQTKAGRKEEARDLARYASGGELSRILLALKQVIGANHLPRTFLFDEVDTGVSGPTAEKVGAKLKNLAKHQQVICVTHLPQVASFADHHYFIEKKTTTDKVEMMVLPLNRESRVREIARLISGAKVTKTSLEHAEELLKQAPQSI